MKFYNGRAIQIPYFDKMDFSQLASKAGIDISGFDSGEMEAGMKEELEHKDVTGGNPVLTFKIVAAHLKEDTNYYSKLESAMSKGGPGSGRRPEGGRNPAEDLALHTSDEKLKEILLSNKQSHAPDVKEAARKEAIRRGLRVDDEKYSVKNTKYRQLFDAAKEEGQPDWAAHQHAKDNLIGKGGPGSGRHPEGYNPLRRDAKFGDEIVFNTGGETLRGTIAGKNEKGELKVVTNSGTIHFRNRNELGMPQGGYKQKGE